MVRRLEVIFKWMCKNKPSKRKKIRTSDESHAHHPSQVPIWNDQNIPRNSVKNNNLSKGYQDKDSRKSRSQNKYLRIRPPPSNIQHRKVTPQKPSHMVIFKIRGWILLMVLASNWFVATKEFNCRRSSDHNGITQNERARKREGAPKKRESSVGKKNLMKRGLLSKNPL